MPRIPVAKTYKLFINGQFPRSESGRSLAVTDGAGNTLAHLCRASRKDLRDAVVAARAAQTKWAERSAYNRAQILYRLAEMTEGKRAELAAAIKEGAQAQGHSGTKGKSKKTSKKSASRAARALTPEREVEVAIDRLVAFAGWADKFAQVLGGHNAVNGPFYNFTIAEPAGLVVAVAPDAPPLLALVSLIAPALCAGNSVIALASESNPVPACVFAEACATSDVPPGVVNILTGERAELVAPIASHRDIDSIVTAGLDDGTVAALRAGSAENLKRVAVLDIASPSDWLDDDRCESPWLIERLVEMKTVWHPAAT